MSGAPQLVRDGEHLRLRGAATLPHLANLQAALRETGDDRTIDIGELDALDTAGAYLLIAHGTELQGASDSHANVLRTVEAAMPDPSDAGRVRRPWWAFVQNLGEAVANRVHTLAELAGYLGMFLSGLVYAVFHPREFRLTATVAHAQDVGVRAVPIVALMAFLIGIVLAFQGSTQLRQFGAEVFVVDLISLSITRELGILLTSIVVAGRTASAFTAAIGSMKMREEVDAMRTLGIDPIQALIVPRVLALLLMLPILGLIANITGLVGGAMMSWIELGISPAMFMTRLVEQTSVNHIIVGFSKAPVFALIIGIIGCHAGMKVKGNAESLGMMTSKAVVAAIFAVIVADAVFSVFFAKIGI